MTAVTNTAIVPTLFLAIPFSPCPSRAGGDKREEWPDQRWCRRSLSTCHRFELRLVLLRRVSAESPGRQEGTQKASTPRPL